MSAEPVARLESVTRRYGAGFALAPTTLGFPAASLTVITGRSGAGKTTLLQILATLDRPDAGTVRLFGRDVTREPESALSEIRRRRLGIVFQTFHFIEHLSVWRNVTSRLVPAGVGAAMRRERAARALAGLGLDAVLDRLPRELSGGELQRVAFARAVIDDPELIVADEPTSNVDAATGAVIADALAKRRAAGATLVIATHDPALVAVADRHVAVEDGRVSSSAPREDASLGHRDAR